MELATTQATVLGELERLAVMLREAVLEGRADAVPVLATAFTSRLSALQNTPGQRFPRSAVHRIHALRSQALAALEIVNRRQNDVQRSLDALGMGTPLLRDVQVNRVYGAAGAMTSGTWRGQSHAQA